jgi:oxepin-CoA hydrolase/3-oxo-5,6-dehydrosuberyl-CoA semialdehyde dehydrogenase
MIELESHLQGKWIAGKGKKATLVNPSTGEALATASTAGVDFRAALDFTRAAGTDLREKTFAERGELLRAMSRAIHAHRDELIGLAIANGGSTRSDAKFDIDGASATLAAYADMGTELGSARVLPDGDAVQLGRGARLFGQHAWVTRQGAAVHVNAFNFPAWGLAEKAAAALLAGMPVVSKPATSTALVSHRIVRVLVEEGVCPPGVLSFVAGSAGDLLDYLSGQDVLAFTGSSDTGALLRGGKAVLARSVRVNVEADSLNAAVLGPDVEDSSDLMNLFVGDVVRDMTQKTGQKCTAIRRVYVPLGRRATRRHQGRKPGARRSDDGAPGNRPAARRRAARDFAPRDVRQGGLRQWDACESDRRRNGEGLFLAACAALWPIARRERRRSHPRGLRPRRDGHAL